MQLRNARLCLDCEEVHDAQQCPSCASESFVFMTRWVPAPERREQPRLQEGRRPSTELRASPSTALGGSPEELQAYRALLNPSRRPNGGGWKLARQGAMGLALIGMAGWLWKSASAGSASAEAMADEKERR